MRTDIRQGRPGLALATALLVLLLAVPAGARASVSTAVGLREAAAPSESVGPAPAFVQSKVECTVKPPATSNVNTNLDCDAGRSPNASTHVVVDPLDPDHIVATSTDYDSNGDQFYTTFNGGQTWKTGEISLPGPKWLGVDPVSAIDPVSGNVMHAMLAFQQTSTGETKNADIVVVRSTDGGVGWRKPVVVADGYGRDSGPKQLFNDKPFIATDSTPSSPTYGRTYVVWAQFFAKKGRYRKSPVAVAWSDDGGRTWTDPKRISGSNPLCTFQRIGPVGRCDETEFPSVTVGPDGSVWAAFLTRQNESIWEPGERFDNTYMVVGSTDGGASWSSPEAAATLEDGERDFPKNIQNRNTFNRYQLRVATGANIAASPTTGDLFLTWTDNRNGVHDVAKPKTDADVFLTTSPDGVAWSPAEQIATGGSDQWFPAVAVNPVTDEVGVLFNQRTAGQKKYYRVRLAEGTPGAFSVTTVSTAPSNPVRSVAFPAFIQRCPWCAYFNGDWIGLAYGSDGSATGVWTDMRRVVRLFGKKGSMESIFVRRFP